MRPQLAKKIVAIYISLVAVAAYIGTQAKFGGIYAVILTLPWSALGVSISDTIDPKLLDDMRIGLWIIFIGAILNSIILFIVVRGRSDKNLGVDNHTTN